jgi:hypothetical protein
MATLSTPTIDKVLAQVPDGQSRDGNQALTSPTILLDLLEWAFHSSASEWLFLRELRVGTGHQTSFSQRLDAFALNSLPHTAMKRICYEVKTSRADFFCEMKQPLKRRIGLRYSNELYFVTPAGLLDCSEIPVECGLIEIGVRKSDQVNLAAITQAVQPLAYVDAVHGVYCIVSVLAPWRETPGPTWQLVAAMLRNQRRSFYDRPPQQPKQQRLIFDW